MTFKKIAAAVLIAGFSCFASAQNVQHVHETFQSGAEFNGDVTFTSTFDNVTAVEGQLTGGSYINDHISWIWNPDFNFSGAPATMGGNFLMDGTDANHFGNFVTFTWNFSAAPTLTFSNAGYGNAIGYTDMSTGGTISAVPEPSIVYLLGLGLAALAFVKRRKA